MQGEVTSTGSRYRGQRENRRGQFPGGGGYPFLRKFSPILPKPVAVQPPNGGWTGLKFVEKGVQGWGKQRLAGILGAWLCTGLTRGYPDAAPRVVPAHHWGKRRSQACQSILQVVHCTWAGHADAPRVRSPGETAPWLAAWRREGASLQLSRVRSNKRNSHASRHSMANPQE